MCWISTIIAVALERNTSDLYCKVKDWSSKFFFAFSPGLGSLEGHADRYELPIQTVWGEVLEDRVIRLSPSLAEEKLIAIVE